ncbi:uncharacterized protein LOC126898223 [Daktulosphaira vitifoliae]|uniref:uncharacterized protein LOC126898223 n=1 Tax=Daktulosphaira vitifoliae TaxID=58002 RepID=UPI0021A98CEB|nr:uncharacterized protein LOC126898223 [Daktulosphaira vitifoliae]
MAYRTKICSQGGLFNAPRPFNYSAETRAFINQLINESKMTTLQRKAVGNLFKTGKQPIPERTDLRLSAKSTPIKRYRSSKPRTLKNIIESGAYEPDIFLPDLRTKNYNFEKEKLQSIMAFGKITKLDPVQQTKRKIDKKSKTYTEEELIDSIILEIENREKFLIDMEMLGKEAMYQDSIINEIHFHIKHLQEFYRKTNSYYRKVEVEEIATKYHSILKIHSKTFDNPVVHKN